LTVLGAESPGQENFVVKILKNSEVEIEMRSNIRCEAPLRPQMEEHEVGLDRLKRRVRCPRDDRYCPLMILKLLQIFIGFPFAIVLLAPSVSALKC